MKRLSVLCGIVVILFCGCQNRNLNKMVEPAYEENNKEIENVENNVYEDFNSTPIGIYQLSGNTLTKLTTITKKLNVEEDIGLFEVYPSNEDVISLDKGFADSFYEKWMEYKSSSDIRLGFNIKFHLITGENVSYNILAPSDAMNRWEHLMNYLYDDYANRGKGFYSHIENEEYNENTLFTAIKLQSSYQVNEIDSKILLTVFTYDGMDDFEDDGEYRGNSSYTFTICIDGITC